MKVSELRTGMLFYLVGTQHIDAVLLDQTGERRLFRVATVESIWPRLDRLINVLYGPLRCTQSEIVETLNGFSHGWGRELLPPREALEPFDILVILPHHFLHYVPFHLIALEDGGFYLGTRFGVSYCSSATLFARAVERNTVRTQDVSSWEFSLDGEESGNAPDPPQECISVGMDIIGQNDENYRQLAKACAGHFKNGRYTTFGRMDLKVPYSRIADVICLVCHGYVDVTLPNNSGLLLASPKTIRNETAQVLHYGQKFYFRDLPLSDLPWQIQPSEKYATMGGKAELMSLLEVKLFMEIQAQLVMLLGCSTAAGQVLSGDSFGSLAYQWLQAGAASVLGHQWEADFGFVSAWTPIFLDHWIHKRQPKAIAMRESIRQVIQQYPHPEEALQIWGAVTLMGDWL
jgi:CHAT domain-containing protein